MDRRDRDNRGAPAGARRNDASPRGARNPNAPAPQPPRRGPAPQAAAPRVPSYEDPNAYRSPGFQDLTHNPYRIDYAGLPKDEEDPEGKLLQPGPGNARFGNGNGAPRGMAGRRPDRTGTDPNAYRSPGFRPEDNKGRRPSPANAAQAPRVDDATADAADAADDSQSALTGPRAPAIAAPGASGASRRERRSQRPRFETTCNACGAAAVVPFEPGPERPAFCKPCYEVKRDELGLGPGKRPPVAPAV